MFFLELMYGPRQSCTSTDKAEFNQSDSEGIVKQKKVGLKKMKVINLPEEQPDNIECSLCHNIIKFKRNVARHMILAHGSGQNVLNNANHSNADKLYCEFCEKVCDSQYHLDRHLKSKNCSKNLLFECKKCKAKFTSEKKLSTHEIKNCLRKYMCTFCFAYFQVKKEFLSHMSSHSNNNDEHES